MGRSGQESRSKARRGEARRGKSRQGRVRQGKARQGKARHGRAGQGRAWQGRGRVRHGMAWHGRAGQGRAGQGRAGQGRAGHGKAGEGKARHGKARQGRAEQGRAGQGRAERAERRPGQGQVRSAGLVYATRRPFAALRGSTLPPCNDPRALPRPGQPRPCQPPVHFQCRAGGAARLGASPQRPGLQFVQPWSNGGVVHQRPRPRGDCGSPPASSRYLRAGQPSLFQSHESLA